MRNQKPLIGLFFVILYTFTIVIPSMGASTSYTPVENYDSTFLL